MRLVMTWITTAAILLGSLFGFGTAGEAVETMAETTTVTFAASDHADVDYADMAYEHIETDAYYRMLDELYDAAEDGDAEAVCALYDSLYDQVVYADAMYTLASIRHDAQTDDEYWQDEYIYTEGVLVELADALGAAGLDVLDTPAAEGFKDCVGEEMAEYFAEYEPMTDEELALHDREVELQEEYYELIDSIYGITFDYRGESWTLEEIWDDDVLWRQDYDAYLAIYEGLNRTLCETFAPVYIELAQIWEEQAALYGYESYADYAYEVFGRAYTPAEAQVFCDAVKSASRSYYGDLYYSELGEEAYLIPDMETDALFDALSSHLASVDASLVEPYAYMTDHGLYDIGGMGSGRYDGAYTTSFYCYGAPFLFETCYGGCDDLITLTHEFGHYADAYLNPMPDPVFGVGDYDLFEIHSNGLQALFSDFYGDIFGSYESAALFMNGTDLLMNVLDGCMFDEFQRRTLAEADSLTAERLNELYLELCVEYGLYDSGDFPEYDAGWVYISHLFLSPMYYISYAASGIAALQLWDMTRHGEFDEAVEAYLSVLHAGAYGDDYFTVLENSGLRLFTEEKAATEVLHSVLSDLYRLEKSAPVRHA